MVKCTIKFLNLKSPVRILYNFGLGTPSNFNLKYEFQINPTSAVVRGNGLH